VWARPLVSGRSSSPAARYVGSGNTPVLVLPLLLGERRGRPCECDSSRSWLDARQSDAWPWSLWPVLQAAKIMRLHECRYDEPLSRLAGLYSDKEDEAFVSLDEDASFMVIDASRVVQKANCQSYEDLMAVIPTSTGKKSRVLAQNLLEISPRPSVSHELLFVRFRSVL
jgi:hypothetical protein